MTQTKIKICGITCPEDAHAAVDAGAHAIGMVFYPPSPRAVGVREAAEIVAALPPFVTVVGLFVDEPAAEVNRILDEVPIDLIQFHGAEPASYCEQFSRPWIKAMRVRRGADIASYCQEYSGARGVLLDNWEEGVPGGTGKAFDWSLAETSSVLPLVLAGGLDEHNVASAIGRLRPWAVDISSGVERSPGRKDAAKIARFIEAVRVADAQLDGVENDQ